LFLHDASSLRDVVNSDVVKVFSGDTVVGDGSTVVGEEDWETNSAFLAASSACLKADDIRLSSFKN
jgi:hypothetical protein